MNNAIVFDIETAPLPIEDLEQLMPDFDPDPRLKDVDKIGADLKKKRDSFIKTARLSAFTGWVCGVGTAVSGSVDVDICTALKYEDEPMVLDFFWKYITDSHGVIKCDVIGHNSRSFDLPFLLIRSRIRDVHVPATAYSTFRGSLSLSEFFKDTMLFAGMGQYNYKISLDNLARYLGVGAKNGDGAFFYETLLEDYEKACDYLRNDVMLTAKIAERLGML